MGGGINGAGIARDAALRGMRVALVEREDFASGTSSRSSRLIHGGVRYLEHGYIHLVFEASRERRLLLRTAPHLVRPLPFTWPVYRGDRLPRWKVRAGLALYDALSLFRNVGNHTGLSRADVLKREPQLRREGLVGGARYYDAATNDARLTLANALAAREAGAVVLNYASVVSLTTTGGESVAVVRDMLGGSDIELRARAVVNAAGPWSDEIRTLDEGATAPAVRGTKGSHISVPRARIGNRDAVTLMSPVDGRVMFVLPAGPMAIIGTTDIETRAHPSTVRASSAEVDYLLQSANGLFLEARLTRADVVAAWAGIRPLIASGNAGNASSASREHEIHVSPSRVVSVSGGKLTTYRSMAAEVVDAAERTLGGRHVKPLTGAMPLPGGDFADFEMLRVAARGPVGDDAVTTHLVSAHGSRWRQVWESVQRQRDLARRVVPGLPYVMAEMTWAVTHELAVTLADLLVRRTFIAYETRDHGRSAAREVAGVVGPLLGWSADEQAEQLSQYDREVDRLFSIDP